MILIQTPIYAKIWKATPAENGKYIDLQATTSEKLGDGSYANSSWFPRAIGKAVNTLKGVKREDRIVITKAKITNERKEGDEGKKSFFRFIILEAEIEGDERTSGSTSAPEVKKTVKPKEEVASTPAEDECPW